PCEVTHPNSTPLAALAGILLTGLRCMNQPVAQSPVQETDRDPEMQIRGCRAAVVSDLGVLAARWALIVSAPCGAGAARADYPRRRQAAIRFRTRRSLAGTSWPVS